MISVSAEAVQVNTTDASLGNAIGNRPITQLPFEARNVVGLLALQPGVSLPRSQTSHNDYRSGAVNGGKSDQGNVTLDGVDVNDQQDRDAFTSVLRVTLDSVQEFRTITSNANADKGRGSGAQVSLVTKSGTNDLHGVAYEYHRNTLTSANSFFNNSAGVPTAEAHPQRLRSVGGRADQEEPAVLLPELRRAARRQRVSGAAHGAQRKLPRRASSPTSENRRQHRPADAGANQETSTRCISARSGRAGIAASYPLPNTTWWATCSTPPDSASTRRRRCAATPTSPSSTTSSMRGNHRLFWRGNLQNDNFANGIPQFPGDPASSVTLDNNKGYAIGYTWLLSPILISNFRYGFTRQGAEITGILTRPCHSPRHRLALRALHRADPDHSGAHLADDVAWTKGGPHRLFGGVVRLISNHRVNYGNSFSDGYANSSWLHGTGDQLLVPDADPIPTTRARWSTCWASFPRATRSTTTTTRKRAAAGRRDQRKFVGKNTKCTCRTPGR